ncbi:MAG: ribonuclease E/G [Planctomycetota bacterium]|jgi:ribonuclease E
MSREMLINVAESEECRVAVVQDGTLEELYVERSSFDNHVGNIYKGRIVNIESAIQAAFVDFGIGKNGFLHISDLHPRYFSQKKAATTENIGKRKLLKDRPPIQKCLKKGQEIVIQVTKEGLKTKGPTLSTYLSLPGKFLVMMPWMKNYGVSHKIEDDEERKRLKDILENSRPPKSHGFIIRTAGEGASKRDLFNDLKYLKRLWSAIENRIDSESTPGELYQESSLVIRTLRDVFNSKINKIICDSEFVCKKIKDFLTIATPRLKRRIEFYQSKVPLFHKYKIEDEIKKVQSHAVQLKSGGSIVIEQTEALVAIDVNSGRYRKQESAIENRKAPRILLIRLIKRLL